MAGPAYTSGVINLAKNEDWQVTMQYLNTIDNPLGDPVDLTDSRIRMQIRSVEEQHTALVECTSDHDEAGVFIADPANGIFVITIWNAESSNIPNSFQLPEGDFVADIVRDLPDGRSERLWEGTVTVNWGTTR